LGIPCASEFRTNFHAYSQHYGVGFLRGLVLGYLRRFHNRCHATMTPTAALASELRAEGFRGLHVVGRGVDTALFHPSRRCEALRRSWGVRPEDLVILSVGRLAPEKNLPLLERAATRVVAARPGTRVVLVGDGPCRGSLARRWPEALLAGRQRGEDLARCYASGDILLFPSLTETFGNVTLEAMASGLGVVAFGYGAAGEVIEDGRSGWLAPVGDADAFVRAAVAAATNPQALAVVRSAAAAMALRLGWDRIVEDIVAVYGLAVRERLRAHPSPKEPESRWAEPSDRESEPTASRGWS
jgi:glycosyltransferase involved in cell wall biosynthesis